MKNRLRKELEAMLELHTGDSFTADNVHTLVNGIFAADEGGGFEFVEYDNNAFPYPQTIGKTAPSITGLGPADESMIDTIFIMPNKETDPDATLMIVVDEKDPSTDPKTYQYVYVGNINDLPSDVLTEGSIVNDLSTGGTYKPLSAEQGRILNSHVNYVTCGSGAADQVKLIPDDGFELSTHLRLLVKMTNTNTNSTPKFNINNTGIKDVWYNSAVASDTNTWSAGEVLDLYYDGTNFNATSVVEKFATGEKVKNVGIEDALDSINKNNVPNAVQSTVLNDKITKITGGECTEVVELDDLEIYYNNAYINYTNGRLSALSNTYTTKGIQLKVGDKIKAFTQGTGIGLIGFRTTDESSTTPALIEYTVLAVANNMTDYIEYTVETDGYYSFSGRQNSLSVIIGKNTNYTGKLTELEESIEEIDGRVDTVEETVDELINGEVISTQITLDDIDDDGAIPDYYLNSASLTCTGGSNLIITKPIYLNVGDSVICQTGGTGIVLFGKSPSENIDRFTTGFTSIKNANSSSVTTYSTIINEAGWYVFSGRINRNDGTNLVVNVIKYSRGKGIQEQLDEKANKSDLTDINIPSIGLSVGADKVKDAIPASPWFDADSQSSGFDYGTYLDDKLDSVPYGQRFIFITDYHYGSNVKNSAKLIDYCRNRLGIKTIIHGGDVHNEHITVEDAVQDWLNFNRDFVFRIGNDFKQVLGDHDRNGGTGHTPISYEVLQKLITGYDSHELTFDNLYDEQVSELGWSSSDMSQYEAFKRMHYFFDDVTIKTRFICLVTRIIPQGQGLVYEKLGNYDSGVLLLQMDFLYSALMSVPKGYNIVVVGHNVVGDKSYSISVGESTVSRYNVNEPVFKGYWSNVIKQIRDFMTKTAFSANIQYLDWESEDIETKNYDFSNAPDAGIVFCMGGDLHWDILAKSQLVNNTETLSTIEVISLPSGTEPTVATQGTINKNTDILNVVTMTDGGDRGYKGIVEPPAQDYDDDTDSFRICKPNTAGTIDSQAFDIVTINDKYISFTRIGSGNDRIVYLE